MPLALAVFLLSAAALAAEVLLMRIFSIAEWHHFAWMIISLALLGYAAAGTFVAIFRRRLMRRLRGSLIAFAFLSAVTLPGSVSLAGAVRFNSLEIVWDPRQMLRLSAIYLLLSIPFFAVAAFMATLFTARRSAVARLYRADLLGAGFGAAAAVAVLFFLPVEEALRLVAAAASLAAGLVASLSRGRTRTVGMLLALAGIALSLVWPRALLRPSMSPYKDLSQALRVPGARVVHERSGPLGLIHVLANDQVPLRHAPGLSLAFTSDLPRQLLLFVDGSVTTAVPAVERGRLAPAYVDFGPAAAVDSILDMRGGRVLVIGADVPAILRALAHGARSVDVVERNAGIIRLLRGRLAAENRALAGPRVEFHCADARALLQSSNRKWRSIESSIDSGGPAGEAALRENYLLTTEGISLLLSRIESGGAASITGPVHMPPNEMMRLVTTIASARVRRGRLPPGSLVVIRSWNTATVLFAPYPFSTGDLEELTRFAEDRSFDLDLPDSSRRVAFNVLDRPYLAEAVTAASGSVRQRDDFVARYKFDLSPATDVRPFFFHFFRWRMLPELLSLRGRGGAPLIEGGSLVLLAALAQALAATAVLVLVPLAIASRFRRRDAGAPAGAWRVVTYFGAIGLAFLFLEIAFLQRFTLFLAHPLYAASIILGSFLACAGIGSSFSRRFDLRMSSVLVAIAVMALLYAAGLRPLFALLAPVSDAAKLIASVVIVAPIAILMGMPFPLGIAHFGGIHRNWIPWAWAVNGSASVISAVLAMLIAMAAGIEVVMIAAALLYVTATVSVGSR